MHTDVQTVLLASINRQVRSMPNARSGGNRKEAVQLLGISRATFYRRLTQFGYGASTGADSKEKTN